jgi:gamma-glutamylcyclotransferase (GGCT)/AIG2-like uncharacterized protein YtfP
MRDLFVYGTLMPGCAPLALRPVLDRAAVVGGATAPGRLYDLGRYPGLVDAASDERVRGVVLRLPDEGGAALLSHLDAYEGYVASQPDRSLFVRVAIDATLCGHADAAGGAVLRCWVWRYNRPVGNAAPVPAGDWLEHLQSRQTRRPNDTRTP